MIRAISSGGLALPQRRIAVGRDRHHEPVSDADVELTAKPYVRAAVSDDRGVFDLANKEPEPEGYFPAFRQHVDAMHLRERDRM